MQITDATKESECCCSCKHNIRKQDEKQAGIYCECEIDGHYIDYISCFENVCERWETDADSEEDGLDNLDSMLEDLWNDTADEESEDKE